MSRRIFLLLLAFVSPTAILTLSNGNPVQDLLEKIKNNKTGGSPNPVFRQTTKILSQEDRTKQVLQSLGVTSNTQPRTFTPASLSQLPALATASAVALFRLGSGALANGYRVSIIPKDTTKYSIASLGDYQIEETSSIPPRLQQTSPLILYDKESCPRCRQVREAVSMLSLQVTFLPCPNKGIQHIPELKAARVSEPFLLDPNTGIELIDKDDMIDYLFRTYGDGSIPWTLQRDSLWTSLSTSLGLFFRLGRGGQAKSSDPPAEPVTVWLYEGSPWCKLVREVLSELEIRHTQVSCPRGSPNRQLLFEQTGRFQVPYLEDKSAGVALFESQAIIEYLEKKYGVARSPVKYL
jgi:glutaredoxin